MDDKHTELFVAYKNGLKIQYIDDSNIYTLNKYAIIRKDRETKETILCQMLNDDNNLNEYYTNDLRIAELHLASMIKYTNYKYKIIKCA